MQQFEHGGILYEELPNGQARVIGPAPGASAQPQRITVGGPKPTPPPTGYAPAGGGLTPLPGGPADKPETSNLPTGWERPTPRAPAQRIPGLPATITDPKPKGGEGELGVAQSKAAGFLSRAEEANKGFEASGATGAQSFATAVGRAVLPDVVEPYILDDKRQQAEANKRAFISSVLRYESGAAIPPEEFESANKTYFPQAGEDEATAATKAKLRADAIQAIRMGAGGGEAPAAQTPGGEHIYEGGSPQGVELNDGGPTIADNPKLAGVNAQVNGMLKQGRPVREVAEYLQGIGVMNAELAKQLQDIARFRKANPGYQGDYTVNVDDIETPGGGFAGGLADAANSNG
jgi:hypothetical protein